MRKLDFEFRAHIYNLGPSHLKILNSTMIEKTPYPSKVVFTGSEGWGEDIPFWRPPWNRPHTPHCIFSAHREAHGGAQFMYWLNTNSPWDVVRTQDEFTFLAWGSTVSGVAQVHSISWEEFSEVAKVEYSPTWKALPWPPFPQSKVISTTAWGTPWLDRIWIHCHAWSASSVLWLDPIIWRHKWLHRAPSDGRSKMWD